MVSDIQPTYECPVAKLWVDSYDVTLRKCMLEVESGPDAGKMFGPLGELSTIGRDPWCEVRLTDPAVSGEHAQLTWTSRGVRLRDLGSRNGTACNDIVLVEGVIGQNARFTVGRTTLRLVLTDEKIRSRSLTTDRTRTLVGTSPAMRRLFASVEKIGPLGIPVLLSGETGTGKTAVAQVIHRMSPRSEGPFVDVNCSVFNASMVESELFGHARGAFTGAHEQTAGVFEQAHRGTLFLDEIGELPLAMQAKLLKVLDDGRVRRVGGARELVVDFRLITATNRDLRADVAAGRFREDLFYRLAGVQMRVPALRDRMSDMGLLADWLANRAVTRIRQSGLACPVKLISSQAVEKLRGYAWPGNVRQLDNVIWRAVGTCHSAVLDPDDIDLQIDPDEEAPSSLADPREPQAGQRKDFRRLKAELAAQEREYFRGVYEEAGGCIARAARLAGISRNYMAKMVQKHRLARSEAPSSVAPPRSGGL